MSINRVVISGNLTREPELRRTQGGMAILSFGVAVNDRKKNQQTGEWEDYANFVDCTVFGKRAESLSDRLYKGMKVAIEGKLRYSQWERESQKRSKLEVAVDEIEFMSRNQQGQNRSNQGYDDYHQNVRRQQDAYAQNDLYDDDCPF
jgi:single-strand DNA-binding protein